MGNNRRETIRMTEDEMWDFISQQKSLQVGTHNADGSIHLSTLWFGLKDKSIIFETYTKSQKILNLQRDPRIALLMEDGKVYEKLRGVTINANAELHTDHEKVAELSVLVLERNNPDLDPEMLKGAVKGMAAKRTAVVIKPGKIVTWDHTKLGGTY